MWTLSRTLVVFPAMFKMYPWYFYFPYWQPTRDRQKRLRLSFIIHIYRSFQNSIFLPHWSILTALHMHPAQSRRLHTLAFGARAENDETCLKHSVCLRKPKIDGARENGPCSCAGRGNERGWKLSSHGTLGHKGGMHECRQAIGRLEGASWCLSPF